MKPPRLLGVVAVLLTLTLPALAGISPADTDSVLFLGQTYCQGLDWCPAFAFWGPTAAGYVELTDANGTPSDYLWVDAQGFLYFESSPLTVPPPAGFPLLGKLVENGQLQEIDQFFPGGVTRPLFIQSQVDQTTPEPSTIFLVAPSAVFLFSRARRFLRF